MTTFFKKLKRSNFGIFIMHNKDDIFQDTFKILKRYILIFLILTSKGQNIHNYRDIFVKNSGNSVGTFNKQIGESVYHEF